MFKIFRKIRFELVDKKTGKYAKYAIGEIILVVIGILIAFSIDNWNTNRVQILEVESYLARLRNEYIYNAERANYLLKGTDNHSLESQFELVDSVRTNFLNGIDSSTYKSILIEDLYWYNQFRMSRDVHDQGVNTGILFKIENIDLLNEIQKHHALMEGRQQWVDKVLYAFRADNDRAVDFKFIREWTKGRNNLTNENILDYDSIAKQNPWLQNVNSDEYKLAFLSIDGFRNLLYSRTGYLISEVEGSNVLISLIAEELKEK